MSFLPLIGGAAAIGLAALTNPTELPIEPSFEPAHHFRFTFDNDVFFYHDKDYTNGIRLDYAQALESGNYWGASLTQDIFTPYTNGTGNIPGEHPYAGYLALGAAYITRGEQFGTSTELQLGTTGTYSYAEECQDFVHELGDMGTWDGWDAQIPGEFTMQVTSRQDFNLKALDYADVCGFQRDALLFVQEELGTVSCRIKSGFVYRYGKNLPPRMRHMSNSATNFGISSLEKSDYDPSANSYFVLAGTSLEYVARDLFIDGGVFHSFEQTCRRTPWIAEVQLGFGVIHKNVDYYFGAVLRSDAYSTAKEHTIYGTLTLGWHW